MSFESTLPTQPGHAPGGAAGAALNGAARSPHALPVVFAGGAVVQLLSADAHADDALVTTLHPATITVTATEVTAAEGDFGWSWLIDEIVDVVHSSRELWSIIAVEGIADFGVMIPADRVVEFRRAFDSLRHHTIASLPTTELPVIPAPVPAPVARPVPPPPPYSPTPVGQPAATALNGAFATTSVVSAPVVSAPVVSSSFVSGGVRSSASDSLAGLDARDISAWFGTHQVLDRVSLDMPAGQVTALIGPSGCGKSTFLRILNRMHEMIPSAQMAGEVVLDGTDVYDAKRKLTDARREIGMVFQKPNPFPAMSIYDNTVASLKLTGAKASAAEKDALVESCLTKAGLWNEVKDRLRQPGGGLSGGQQQRLCIARALAIRPRVLLMDEPCSALDPTSTRRIEETITELVHELTIVIVTHNMQQAARVSNQCAFFLAEHGTPGVIVEYGATAAMFDSPQDQRTDDYVNGRFG